MEACSLRIPHDKLSQDMWPCDEATFGSTTKIILSSKFSVYLTIYCHKYFWDLYRINVIR